MIGLELYTHIDGVVTSGIITETEAYAGEGDKACHAHLGRFTKRTSVMYEKGGISYIYLCYGIHHLFNIVTNIKAKADAVLIRAFEPKTGIEKMLERRKKLKLDKSISSGPGNVSQALGLSTSQNGISVCSDSIWLEQAKEKNAKITETTRIGIDYAGKDALLPWRFYTTDSKYVSVR